jgi:peptidoglycan/xylan/chitin deacetylase (PgdA/CDA1 family)
VRAHALHPRAAVLLCFSGFVAIWVSLVAGGHASTAASPPLPLRIYSAATTGHRVVALTFDDGPSVYTPGILDILRKQDVPATFFVIGEHVAQYPRYVRAERAQGDLVGDHTYTHPDLEQLSPDQIRAQLSQTEQAIRSASGYSPRWFRPPYGDVDSEIVAIAASLGLRTVLWSVDPQDWALPGSQAIVDRVLTAAKPGSVILMHDGGGDRSETVAALPAIIDVLRSRGYTFNTLDQLFGLAPVFSCPPDPTRLFSQRNVPAQPDHAIYKTWLRLICQGINLGPATSPEYVLRPHVMVQDFRVTAHQIEWASSTRRTTVVVRWDWAAAVFSRRGIQPRWGHPITHDWMKLYLSGHDRGPALDEARWIDHRLQQRFLRGTAIQQPGGTVSWRLIK